MLRRIVLENYMSHARTVIEPAEGLTVLVGPNNCGKSAVVSALQTLCTNLSGDYMVRHGQRDARVTVETDDGHVITWQRAGASVSYIIDGEEISRLRGGIPDRLHQLLRLPEVRSAENGEDEFDIHFGTQKAPIFLLNEPERRAAMFFAASSDAALLLQMQKRHSDKVRDSKRQRDGLEKDRIRLDRELAALTPVTQLADRLRNIELEYEAVLKGRDEVARLTIQVATIACEWSAWSLHHAELTALGPLQAPYEPVETAGLQSVIHDLETTNKRAGFETRQLAAVLPLRDLPVLEDAAALAALTDSIQLESAVSHLTAGVAGSLESLAAPPSLLNCSDLEAAVRHLSDSSARLDWDQIFCGALESLHKPPELGETDAVQKFTEELGRALDQHRNTERATAILAKLGELPQLSDFAPLALVIAQVDECHAATSTQMQLLNTYAEELFEVEQGIRQWAELNRTCKVCGAPLDADRLLQEPQV